MLEKFFKLKENNTNVKTEVMAGITTFMTMAYILAVNPNILSASGMDKTAILLATAIASFIGTLCMAFMANYPFALAPGMGLNAFFAFTVCSADAYGYSWKIALLAVFVEGIIFIILSITNIREAIFNAIPFTLKAAVSAGIGLFIAFIGLQNAKLVVDSSTLVTYQSFDNNFNSVGIGAILALLGVIITAIMVVKNVKGAILWGIIVTWVLGIICELTGIYVPNPAEDVAMYSVIPEKIVSFDFTALGNTFGQLFTADFKSIKVFEFVVIVFAFLFVDVFDTLGTLIGVSTKANMLDENGKLPRIKGALMADAVATTAGAVLGTSTTTTFVESAAGVTEGGRTGLTAVVTGLLFLLSIIFSPLFLAIPGFATAPALIIVGFYMMSSVMKIDWDNALEAIPAFLCVLCMPLMYSISEGIAIGVISWTLIHVFTGKTKGKVNLLMYILTILFVLKYVFL